MTQYTTPAVVKHLASQLVAAQVACGQRKIITARQFRAAVIAVAHRAFLGV